MPLIFTQLANEFESAWRSQNPSEMPTAQKEAKAISAFIDSGMTAMGGVPSSAPMLSVLANDLASIWQAKMPGADIIAQKEALAIHTMLTGTITSGGKHGVGGFMSGSPAALGNDLAGIYKDQMPSENMVAMKKAQAIDSYVKSCVFRGSGVGPDFVPDISGLT